MARDWGPNDFSTIQSDLGVVASFSPDVVSLQVGTNELTFLSAFEVGSALEDLTRLLFESYGVKHICVCQTLYHKGISSLNKLVSILPQYLKIVFEPIPYVVLWCHRGFWKCKTRFLPHVGIHLNNLGQYSFFRSLRGTILTCLKNLTLDLEAVLCSQDNYKFLSFCLFPLFEGYNIIPL